MEIETLKQWGNLPFFYRANTGVGAPEKGIYMTEKGKDIILGIVIAFIFTVLEMVITFLIVRHTKPKDLKTPVK
jgi:hypothetical protein